MPSVRPVAWRAHCVDREQVGYDQKVTRPVPRVHIQFTPELLICAGVHAA
jgi:hypothetical protein